MRSPDRIAAISHAMRLVKITRRAGAQGAKVCGAGGGGCVFFLVERGARE
jgi:mevalonate kinase